MFRKCVLFVVLLLSLHAGIVAGQPGIAPPYPDRIGVYTTSNCASDNMFVSIGNYTIYCVLTGVSNSEIQGFECNLDVNLPGDIYYSSPTYASSSWLNFSSFPECLVGGSEWVYPGFYGEVVLFSVDCLVISSLPLYVSLQPIYSSPPGIPGEMAYYDTGSNLYPMYPVSGDHALPVFGFNTGPVWYDPGEIIIDVEPDAIAPMWELSGPGTSFNFGFGDQTFPEMTPGDYVLLWSNASTWTTPTPNPVEFTLAPGGSVQIVGEYLALPQILSVDDVPNDQGRQVRLNWQRCPYDSAGLPGYTITEYGVYRQQDDTKLADWDYVGSVPARGDLEYQYVAPTLCDSTVADGLCESTFMISAMTPDPLVYFDSAPGTGYSVDNLRPVTPAGFRVEFSAAQNRLTWDAPLDTDVDHYLVYRTSSADTPPDPLDPPLAQVFDTAYDDDGGWDWVYWVVAVDHAGNRSDLTEWSATELTGIEDGTLPRRTTLHAAAPNPFNPSTTLAFDLPSRCAVTLSVFDMSGQKVRDLIAGESVGEGHHEVVWNGRDTAGRQVASGTYVYRLEAGAFSAAKRMVLLK